MAVRAALTDHQYSFNCQFTHLVTSLLSVPVAYYVHHAAAEAVPIAI